MTAFPNPSNEPSQAGVRARDRAAPAEDVIDEAALVRRLKQRQEWACTQLVSLYQDRLLRIAYGITLDQEESREIVQDVFFKAIDKIRGFRGDAGLGPWLGKITVNACLNWKRKWKRRFRWHHTALEPETEFLTYDRAKSQPTPETRLREKQSDQALAEAVRSLPEKIRVVFVLNTMEGLPYAEIAEILGIKEGTVSSRLYRARQLLTDRLNAQGMLKGGTP